MATNIDKLDLNEMTKKDREEVARVYSMVSGSTYSEVKKQLELGNKINKLLMPFLKEVDKAKTSDEKYTLMKAALVLLINKFPKELALITLSGIVANYSPDKLKSLKEKDTLFKKIAKDENIFKDKGECR